MIPLFRPSCSDLEIEYVTQALRSGWWGMGPRTEEFEHRFAAFIGAKYAVALNSCTAALELACEVLGVAGGEVIVPALSFVSTAMAPLRAGARVVFADVDEDTLCIDWADADAKVTSQTRAFIPVWYGGTVIPGLSSLPVIEDCAHAAGSEYAGKSGMVACWSFHAVKNLATGDGGMITTDHPDIAGRLRRLRWCGIDRSTWDRENRGGGYGWDYQVRETGHKAHINDLTAALGLAQLERLPVLNEARRLRVRQYLDALKDLPFLRLPAYREGSSWHLFWVRVDASLRDRFIAHMLAHEVSAGVHYKPLNHYPVFGPHQALPVTDRVWRELVTLPLFPDMTDEQFEWVVSVARSFRA